MKTLTIISLMLLSMATIAQTQNGFSYQAVIRNGNGELVKNAAIGLQVSILQGSETGTAVYTETQTPMTNSNGLLTTEIGTENAVAFSAINWSAGPYFLKTETDINGGANYSISGTSQLHSVPFAKYAAKAGNGLDYPTNPKAGDIVYSNGTNWELLPKGTNGQTLRLDDGKPNWAEPGYALPIVTTAAPTDVMVNAATTGGHIIATGFTDITAKGVCWATTQNPTTENDKTNYADGIGTFTSQLKDLQPNTTYYARAFATNGAGTAYGNQVSFKTFQNVVFPTITTAVATNITANAVTTGGNITATGGGEITARGVCWSNNQNPTIYDSKTENGDGSGQFQSQISGLIPGTYYARAYATNSSGTGYGNMVSFTTEKTLPVLTTKNISDISAMGAVSGGSISSAGGGTISARGICWSDSPNPTITNEKTGSPSTSASFSAAIAKAAPNTMYYIKAFATNEIGTGYGDEKTFTTSESQYYTSFEAGMTPVNWSGSFNVSSEAAFDGSYSIKSLFGRDCDAIFEFSLEKQGQVSFYYLFKDHAVSIDFYIDDEKIANYPNDGMGGWRQGIASISSGTHIIKWHYTDNPGKNPYSGAAYNGNCYLDQITITK